MVEHFLPIFWGIPTSTPTVSWKRCHRAAASMECDILAAMDEILTPLRDVAFLNFPVSMSDHSEDQMPPVSKTACKGSSMYMVKSNRMM